jgi:UDPglucose 6-dehydrogenase
MAPYLNESSVIATKSTVPVGTSREIKRRLHELRPDLDLVVCSNPEFLREGSAIRDFMHPDRVLIGCSDSHARDVMLQLYHPVTLRNAPIMFVSPESAELAKYAANAFLAMKITFINEVADLCETVGAAVGEVATAIGADNRIGSKFLHAGPGYGGSCFPKDVTALIRTAREARAPLSLVEQVDKVNTERKISMAMRIEAAVGESLRNKVVAMLGVTFKPNTDDMRDAPSLVIVPMLQARGAIVRAYDPQVTPNARAMLPGVEWHESALETAQDADVTVLLTEWHEFRALDLRRLRQAILGDVLVDLRNVYSEALATEVGFTYYAVGNPPPTAAGQRQDTRRKFLESAGDLSRQ